MLAVSEKIKKADLVMKEINKKYKKQTVARVSTIRDDLAIKFIPTKSIKLNSVLNGGIAKGRVTELFGPHSSGKTFTCYEIIGEDMRNNPDSIWVWFETEGSFDISVAERCGVDGERLIYYAIDDDGAEKGLDMLEMLVRQLEDDITGIVVNSVAGLVPKNELESGMDKMDMGVMAKMMSKLPRKITHIVATHKIACIFINQVRDKIGKFTMGTTTCGGRALSFFASQRVEFVKRRMEKGDSMEDSEYIKICIKIHKNRFAVGNPYVTTEVYGRYGVGTDTAVELIQLGIEQNFINKGNGGRYSYTTLAGEELKWHGGKKLIQAITENKSLYNELYSRIQTTLVGDTLTNEEIQFIQLEDECSATEVAEHAGGEQDGL